MLPRVAIIKHKKKLIDNLCVSLIECRVWDAELVGIVNVCPLAALTVVHVFF